MAVYSRTNGNLPTTTSGGNTSTQTAPLASKDLGTIIVKSLQTVADSLSGNDVPVSYKDVEKAVTQGVNKSDLVKKGMKNGNGMIASGGAADKALAAKYEQDKFIKWQEYQRKLQKEQERDREELKQKQLKDLNEMKQKVDETWNGIATAIDNPLKGISNLLDKTVKDFSTGFLKGYKDAKDKKKNNGEESNVAIGTVTSSPELVSINQKMDDLSDLITDNFDEIKENQVESSDQLAELIKDDDDAASNDKQKDDEQKAKDNEEKKDRDKQLNATQKVGYVVGQVMGTIGKGLIIATAVVTIGSQLMMFIKGKLYQFLAEMPVKSDIRMAKIKAALTLIPEKIKIGAEKILSKIHFPGFSYGGLSSDEKSELKALEKKDSKLQKAQGKLTSSATTWLGADAENYDINDPEQREALRQAMLEKTRSQIAQGITPAMSESEINSNFKNYEKALSKSDLTPEERARLQELQAIKNADYDKLEADIDAKKEGLVNQYVGEAIQDRMDKGTLTEFQADTYGKYGYSGLVTAAQQEYESNTGQKYTYAQATEKEAWLKEKYEPWKDAWANFGKNMKMDLNIETQRPAKRNALNSNGNPQ